MRIGDKVHCRAYLRKFSDGVYMTVSKPNGEPLKGNAWDEMWDVKAYKNEYTSNGWVTKEIADLSDYEGNTVPKQYRKRVEDEFDGVFVGFTRIVVSGRIGTDTKMLPYNMNGDLKEVYHLIKETDKQKVGVVYFKNNARRYVPLDDMERKEE